MTVRKKVVDENTNRDTMDLSGELAQVRKAITSLPTEGVVMNETTATPETPASSPEKATKKKSTVVKKVTAEPIKLKDLCRTLKMDTRQARKILRTKKVKNPGRWTWPKGSSEVSKVTSLLKASQAK